MYWDRFDICLAYYTYAYLWHGGQWSEEYGWLGRLEAMRFRPSIMFSGEPRDLEANARQIYQGIVLRRLGRWSTISNPCPR